MDHSRLVYWAAYVHDLKDRIGLRDWEVGILERPSDDGANASIQCTYGRKWAEIMLGIGFDKMSPDDQRCTLTHELLHCHFWGVNQVMHGAAGNVGKRWVDLLSHTVKTHLEYGIDAVADALASSLPLPPVEEQEQAA